MPARSPPIDRRDHAGDRRQAERRRPTIVPRGAIARIDGASALPAIVPSDDSSDRRRPNQHVAAVVLRPRNSNASRKSMNPTAARRISIAAAASCTLGSSAARCARRRWASGRGDNVARQPQRGHEQREHEQRRAVDQRRPRCRLTVCSSAAGTTATKPARPAIRPSFELASTSSRSVRTTDGTSADFDTMVRLLQHEGDEHQREQRQCRRRTGSSAAARTSAAAATACTTMRRPPACGRSPGRSTGRRAGTGRS